MSRQENQENLKLNSELKKTVYNYAKEHALFEGIEKVVVGLSGGVDSVALLSLLYDLGEEGKLKIEFYPMYVHHGLREDADMDIQICKDLCYKLGLSLEVAYVDVKGYVESEQVSIEDGARILRYEALRKYLIQVGASYIAVAHHKEDQAETVLHRMIRGSGLKGIGGMVPKSKDIIRPFLGVSKKELEIYVKSKGYQVVIDATNRDTIYTRNRIRHDLIPMIQEQFNEKVVDNLSNLADILQEEELYLEKQTKKAYKELLIDQHVIQEDNQHAIQEDNQHVMQQKDKSGRQIIVDTKLFEYAKAIKRRVIRKAIKEVKGDLLDIQYHHIQSIMDMEFLQSGRVLHIHKFLYVKKEYNKLIFYKPSKENVLGFSYSLDTQVNKRYIQEVKLAFSVKTINYEQYVNYKDSFKNTEKVYTKCFDYDKIKANLVLRSRKVGDVIHIHKDGRKKTIKKFFIDEKIPSSQRDLIPLLADGNIALWIVGYRTNPTYEVFEDTQVVLVVKLIKEDYNGSED